MMVNSENEQTGIDNAEKNVLRAGDIMPPYGPKLDKNGKWQEKTPPDRPIATKSSKDIPIAEIPTFDLAEQIMAKQRNISAVKRRPPSQKSNFQQQTPQGQSINIALESTGLSVSVLSKRNRIIADIVARDIEKLGCY